MSGVPKRFLDGDDQWWRLETPHGAMVLAGNEKALHHLLLPNAAREAACLLGEEREGRPAPLAEAERQLKEYFGGTRRDFELPLEPLGSDFQRAVWWALATIPFGATASYGEIARQVGRPTAFRAVGLANGRNPLPVLLPCHRVIGANGTLTGYGGGLELKEALLGHERSVLEAV